MADATVTFLLEKVWDIGRSYVNLIAEDKNELRELGNELNSLKAFLQQAAKKANKEEFYKETERQIRELVYDAEDTIDTCLTQETVKTKKFWKSRKRLSLAKEVKGVRERVKPMLEKAERFARIESGEGSGKPVEEPWIRARKVQSIRQDNIVGFEDEEATIINYLMEPKEALDVISIIGMPGLGKTTLAWKIYKNKNIRFQFPVCIWVCVSQAFSRKDVFLKILSKFTNHDMSSQDEDFLKEKIHEHLGEEKFFLVLDDVWTIDAWNAIQVLLPKKNCLSKVLITSRYTNVGKHANPMRAPHNLRFLTEKESWQLLQLEVFGKLDDCPDPELRDIGESIAKGCDGLPLAIVVIGGILLGHLSTERPMKVIIDDWIDVYKNLSTYLVTDENVQGISDIVALSYGILPTALRDCFLYLGVFPEDYEIPTWTLTRLWIAEGFIQQKQGRSLEDTAEENLKDLVDRNLVMVEKRNPSGEVKTCRVHDVIRAFCISKAAITEQNLFQEIKLSNGVFNPSIADIEKFRRLCIHSDLPDFLSKEPKGPHVRSVLCFNKAPFDLDAGYMTNIPDAFKLLRILDSKFIRLKRFPDRVTKLIQLRYITLSINNFDALPEEVSELCNLETLVVDTNSRRLTIEANIWTMIKLRHLKTKAAIVLAMKEEGKGGENLQTLSTLSPDCTQNVLNKASNLRRLGIRGKLATLFEVKSLKTWHALEKLKLVNDTYSGSTSQLDLPPSIWFPKHLKRLTISATWLNWEQMSILAKIDTLQVLKLKDDAFRGMTWNVGDCFRSLHFLLIADTDLIHWVVASTEHFPKLRSLVLKNCQKLKAIPSNLAETLEKLEIEYLGPSAVESAEKIGEIKKPKPGQPKPRFGGEFKLIKGLGCGDQAQK